MYNMVALWNRALERYMPISIYIVQDVCSMVNILFEEKPSLEYTFLLCWPGGFLRKPSGTNNSK